jgi:hypothetical protein
LLVLQVEERAVLRAFAPQLRQHAVVISDQHRQRRR